MRRVTSGPVVILTADPDALGDLWLAEYAPQFHATERRRYPSLGRIEAGLAGGVEDGARGGGESTAAGSGGDGGVGAVRPLEVRPLRIPLGCTDGFADAFYGRPEAMLDPAVRRAQSAWSLVAAADQDRFVTRLRADLDSGAWDARFAHLRTQPEFIGSIRILIATPR
jgi:hypothetical protein